MRLLWDSFLLTLPLVILADFCTLALWWWPHSAWQGPREERVEYNYHNKVTDFLSLEWRLPGRQPYCLCVPQLVQ